MATKVRLDELETQKLGTDGEPVAAKTQKEHAQRLVLEAMGALPKGVPASSPYAKLTRDELLGEAARLDMRFGPLLTEDELRLVTEHARVKLTSIGAPTLSAPAPEVPMQPVPPVRIRGLKPSPTNTWRVVLRPDQVAKPPTISVGNGQMTTIRQGALIELRHYSVSILQGIANQGIKLVPIEEPEAED